MRLYEACGCCKADVSLTYSIQQCNWSGDGSFKSKVDNTKATPGVATKTHLYRNQKKVEYIDFNGESCQKIATP